VSDDAPSHAGAAPTPARILLATGNAHKVAEVQAILGDSWHVVAQDPGVPETGDSFEENALIKARALAVATGELALADDSGIEIDALDGGPGIYSARWTDESDWLDRVLRELEGVAPGDRGCRYVCAAAAVWPVRAPRHATGVRSGVGETREVVVRGTVEGVVAHSARGTGGFGYDPLMMPLDGDGRTFAEMPEPEKHALSHRGRAFRALLPELTRP
jgi:XTP/dITP diphosphohydrolase